MFNYSLCIACSGIFRWLRCLLLPNLLCHVRARLLVIKRLIHHRLSYSHSPERRPGEQAVVACNSREEHQVDLQLEDSLLGVMLTPHLSNPPLGQYQPENQKYQFL
ncbi:hypothetical protein OIU78_004063 [Salix suchowensis]|nr:hypothetical protein OIU78_004063 [Salix suchowensis]